MKMAKASENDLRAALDLCAAFESLRHNYLPDEICESPNNEERDERYDERKHAAAVVDYLIDIATRGSLFRVCFGMTVLLDPKNEIVDPDDSALEIHPKFETAARDREELLTLAEDAHEAWDKDQDARVGKLLLAMIDPVFRKTYRPDLGKVGAGDTAEVKA